MVSAISCRWDWTDQRTHPEVANPGDLVIARPVIGEYVCMMLDAKHQEAENLAYLLTTLWGARGQKAGLTTICAYWDAISSPEQYSMSRQRFKTTARQYQQIKYNLVAKTVKIFILSLQTHIILQINVHYCSISSEKRFSSLGRLTRQECGRLGGRGCMG